MVRRYSPGLSNVFFCIFHLSSFMEVLEPHQSLKTFSGVFHDRYFFFFIYLI